MLLDIVADARQCHWLICQSLGLGPGGVNMASPLVEHHSLNIDETRQREERLQGVARVVAVVDAVGSPLAASRSKRPRSRIGKHRTEPRHVRTYRERAGHMDPVR